MSAMKPTVLYVEDDADSREVMMLILTEIMGCDDYHIFDNSENFMARVTGLLPQPNVILLDIHVPPYSGFEMLKMLRENPAYQRLPIVALTASVMNEEVQQLQDAGFSAVFAKPLDIEAFPDQLMRILQGENVLYISD